MPLAAAEGAGPCRAPWLASCSPGRVPSLPAGHQPAASLSQPRDAYSVQPVTWERGPNGELATAQRQRGHGLGQSLAQRRPESGLCTACHDGCTGGCEIFLSTMRGREVLYPQNFGEVTAGADKDYPVDYSHLNIQGYAVGADGLPDGVEPGPDTALFPKVDTETEYGWDKKVKMKMPVFTGALGSTEIARRNWEHFAVGAAISGITLVCGENVCGIDPGLELTPGASGQIAGDGPPHRNLQALSDGLRRDPRPDERRGHALRRGRVRDGEARRQDHRAQVGPGRQVHRRRDQGRPWIAPWSCRGAATSSLPDPSNPGRPGTRIKDGAISEFERHSRLGFVTRRASWPRSSACAAWAAKRVTLKTGAYRRVELAMAIKLRRRRRRSTCSPSTALRAAPA